MARQPIIYIRHGERERGKLLAMSEKLFVSKCYRKKTQDMGKSSEFWYTSPFENTRSWLPFKELSLLVIRSF